MGFYKTSKSKKTKYGPPASFSLDTLRLKGADALEHLADLTCVALRLHKAANDDLHARGVNVRQVLEFDDIRRWDEDHLLAQINLI